MSCFLQCLPKSTLEELKNKFTRKKDFFNNLPPEIIVEILSSFPIESIRSYKRVCKSWRDLAKRPDFGTSYLSKQSSASCVAVSQRFTPFKIFRFVDDEHEAESLFISNNCFAKSILYSSTNGLLFLLQESALSDNFFICNPVTREYIDLRVPHPQGGPFPNTRVFGFGVSKITGQYKVVRVIREDSSSETRFSRHACEVYTLGTGRWRSITTCSRFEYKYHPAGVFVNGNLHWLVYDSENNCPCILCLDLETELFTSFSPPLDFPHDHSDGYRHPRLSALGDRLCLYNNNSYADEFFMWSMKDYGDEKSWTEDITMRAKRLFHLLPVEVLEGGEILLAVAGFAELFCYSNETGAMRTCRLLKGCGHLRENVVSYTPSFVSLKGRLRFENVVSF